MKLLMSIVFALGFAVSSSALGLEEHSENVCSTINEQICAHIGMHEVPVVGTPSNFMVHFLVEDAVAEQIKNVDVLQVFPGETEEDFILNTLTFEQKNATHYMVKEAVFEKAGQWFIAVVFDYNGETDMIEIPLSIK